MILATGGLIAGCYFVRTTGLTVVRTARETAHTITAKRAGSLCSAWVAGGMETVRVADDAALARWACRLAAELGGAVELRVTHNNRSTT